MRSLFTRRHFPSSHDIVQARMNDLKLKNKPMNDGTINPHRCRHQDATLALVGHSHVGFPLDGYLPADFRTIPRHPVRVEQPSINTTFLRPNQILCFPTALSSNTYNLIENTISGKKIDFGTGTIKKQFLELWDVSLLYHRSRPSMLPRPCSRFSEELPAPTRLPSTMRSSSGNT